MPVRCVSAAALSLALLVPLAGAALPKPDADNGGLTLPAGFRAAVVADDVGPARFCAVAPDGTVFVALRTILGPRDAEGRRAPVRGGIVALRDTDGDGTLDQRSERFGPDGGTGIAVREGFLYFSSDRAVYRWPLPGDGALVPAGQPELIAGGFPDQRGHEAKAFTFDDAGRLYVDSGAPSNACGHPDRVRGARGQTPCPELEWSGGLWRFEAARPGQMQRTGGVRVATGLRHVLSLAFHPVSRRVFLVMQGRDQLDVVAPEIYTPQENAELPGEEFHELVEGSSYGWPFTYWDPLRHRRIVAPEYGGDGEKGPEAGLHRDPLFAFPAHWAPMQMVVYTGGQFPARYRGGMFVAFHGSWNRAPEPQRGYHLCFVPFDAQGRPAGGYEVFADGFAGVPEVRSPRDARARPIGVALGPDGSLYVTDSVRGRLWRIFHPGR